MKKHILLGLVLVFLFFGCSPSKKNASIVLSSKPRTLNPLKYKELAISTILCNVYEPLVIEDELYNLRPCLATYWERLDSVTWIFYLREGVEFHNGKTLNADDVVYSFYYPKLDTTSEFKGYFIYIDTVYAVDDNKVLLKTKFPYELLLVDLIDYNIVPNGYQLDSLTPCGTGPYLFEYISDTLLVLKKWKKYWGAKPFFRFATIKFAEEPSKRLDIFIKGKADLIDYVPLEHIDTVLKYGKLLYTPESSLRLLTFNLNVYPFSDKNFRRAVCMAINREEIVKSYYKGFASSANQIFPIGMHEFNPLLPPLNYEPEKARDVFRKFQIQNDLILDYAITVKPFGDLVVKQLRQAGLNVVGNPLPSREFWEKIKARKFQFYLAGVIFGSRTGLPHLIGYYHTPSPEKNYGISNRSHFSNQKVDSLIEFLIKTPQDNFKRDSIKKLMEILLDEMPVCPITFERVYFGAKKDIIWTPGLDGRIYISKIRRQ